MVPEMARKGRILIVGHTGMIVDATGPTIHKILSDCTVTVTGTDCTNEYFPPYCPPRLPEPRPARKFYTDFTGRSPWQRRRKR